MVNMLVDWWVDASDVERAVELGSLKDEWLDFSMVERLVG